MFELDKNILDALSESLGEAIGQEEILHCWEVEYNHYKIVVYISQDDYMGFLSVGKSFSSGEWLVKENNHIYLEDNGRIPPSTRR